MKASENPYPSVLFDEQASDIATPAADRWVLYTKSGGVYARNSAGTVVGPFVASTGSFVNKEVTVTPQHLDVSLAANGVPTASAGVIMPMVVHGEMRLRSAVFHMQAAASGTYQWGLFDGSASLTAATKLAGASGALNATGWVALAASGAPITIPAGQYFFIFLIPAANQGNMYRVVSSASDLVKSQGSYAWDDTPDLTTGWTNTANQWSVYLLGDMDAASTQW